MPKFKFVSNFPNDEIEKYRRAIGQSKSSKYIEIKRTAVDDEGNKLVGYSSFYCSNWKYLSEFLRIRDSYK